jgi:SNF2 family DNA or RNA helicase
VQYWFLYFPQVILKNIMLRRRKEDTLNGKKLIELPARTVTVLPCSFDSSEKAFYSALEDKMGIALDKLMEKGDANKNYMSVLLLLLRLRQGMSFSQPRMVDTSNTVVPPACNHPLLVSKDYKKDAEAVEPTAAKAKTDGDVDGDDLVAAFGALGVTRKCQVCTTSYVSGSIHTTVAR